MHKRTLEPIKTLVYGLRRYDVDRCAALTDAAYDSGKVQGYMSHKSKIYLVRNECSVPERQVAYRIIRLMSMITLTM